MGREYALSDELIKEVLRLIDTNRYTQQELAIKFGVSQGTISRYNRVTRMKLKLQDYAKLIARQNLELANLRQELGKENSDKNDVKPNSFITGNIAVLCTTRVYDLVTKNKENADYELFHMKINDEREKLIRIYGFFTERRDDAVKFITRHPEYSLYTIRHEEKVGNTKTRFKDTQLRSNCSKNVYKEFVSRVDFGYLGSTNGVDIVKIEN